MTDSIMTHMVVPIANENDATATCEALESAIDEPIERITVVHVIEKRDRYPDKAPLEARQEQAERIFRTVEDWFPDGPPLRRELRYGTNVVDEILDVAEEVDATAIGFVPQSSGRLHRLLSGRDSYRLITESEQPAVVFSRVD
ncbi:universal stress protein [Natronococcus pandeyae]|uniref:Universal stress protein n=1 Tax=Natronococcus pandeyae TaxID=2055836 RepID=A0A8J8Q1K2_9EURY|nr:universal stress protein [Natronococcus pandeyae]TYL37622.1 universal stress protein [Natronococcus pandeyae]